MTVTDELRRLLDERDVIWRPSGEPWNEDVITYWYASLFKWTAIEGENGLWVNAGVAGYNSLTPEQAVEVTLGPKITGETSDGYHTFNELYHHRAVLFSVIVRDHPEIAWKSKKHHDGTMYDGMFIVGIDTPQGQATYHYDTVPYWDMFECRELDTAPEWDGHTSDDAIARIATV